MRKIYIIAFIVFQYVLSFGQIPNASFENWTGNYPDGWTTRLTGSPYNLVSQNSTAHSGLYALKSTHLGVAIQTYIYDGIYTGNQSTNFYVPNGNIKPTMLLGWYTLTNNTDSFTVDVKFKNAGLLIGTGTFATKANTVGYAPLVVNINYTSSAVPDSFYIGISWNHCTIASNGTCNTSQTYGDFIIDDLSFSTQVGLTELNNSIDNLILSPNPANSTLNIHTISDTQNQLQNATLQITNCFGQVVLTSPFTSQINISTLSSGIYFLTIQDKSSIKTFKIIKQ